MKPVSAPWNEMGIIGAALAVVALGFASGGCATPDPIAPLDEARARTGDPAAGAAEPAPRGRDTESDAREGREGESTSGDSATPDASETEDRKETGTPSSPGARRVESDFSVEGRSRGDTLVRVADREITSRDVADVFLYFYRDAYYQTLRYLVEGAIVAAEARRLGVTLTREEVSRAVDAELASQDNEVRVQFGADVPLEAFVEDNFKIDMATYRLRVQSVVKGRMLRDAVIRYSLLRGGYADLRKIVVTDEELAHEIRTKVDAGADFDTLARNHSIVLSREDGGKLEEVRRGFLGPGLDEPVFALAVGEVTPVLTVEREGETHYHLYRMVRRVPGERLPFEAVRERVAAGIDEKPVSDLEALQWNRVMATRYPVVYEDL